MATVLKFLPRLRPERTPVGEQSAEIIIFPGVRYERMADESPAKAKRKRRSRKRALVISA